VRPELPKTVGRVVAQALSRDPTRRFPDLEAFLAAFREAAGLETVATVDPTVIGRGGPRRTPVPLTGRGGPRRDVEATEPFPARPLPPSSTEASATETDDDTDAAPRRGWWPFGRRGR
jgi:hypothetical protein